MRTAEAAREKEKDAFSVAAGLEHRRRMAAALATTVLAAEGLTAEVIADADRLERERGAMLVPQVSALVGCQVRERKKTLLGRASVCNYCGYCFATRCVPLLGLLGCAVGPVLCGLECG